MLVVSWLSLRASAVDPVYERRRYCRWYREQDHGFLLSTALEFGPGSALGADPGSFSGVADTSCFEGIKLTGESVWSALLTVGEVNEGLVPLIPRSKYAVSWRPFVRSSCGLFGSGQRSCRYSAPRCRSNVASTRSA